MKKTYTGNRRNRTPETPNNVVLVNGKNLEHHVRHSPDGFEWGYCGSGPAELARCILIDFFDGDLERAGKLYQDFKNDFIAGFKDDWWKIENNEINSWLARKTGGNND